MEKTKIQPLGDRVLVKRRRDAEEVKGGIVIPDTAKEQSQEAEVVALGTGKVCDCKDNSCKQVEFEVQVGDRVLISRYGGNEFKIDGVEYVLIKQCDILGVLCDGKKSCGCGAH
jgi:chaperonin GroES